MLKDYTEYTEYVHAHWVGVGYNAAVHTFRLIFYDI